MPTVIFGPRPNNLASIDEYISVDDLVAVTKVHLATALDFLLELRLENGPMEHDAAVSALKEWWAAQS